MMRELADDEANDTARFTVLLPEESETIRNAEIAIKSASSVLQRFKDLQSRLGSTVEEFEHVRIIEFIKRHARNAQLPLPSDDVIRTIEIAERLYRIITTFCETAINLFEEAQKTVPDMREKILLASRLLEGKLTQATREKFQEILEELPTDEYLQLSKQQARELMEIVKAYMRDGNILKDRFTRQSSTTQATRASPSSTSTSTSAANARMQQMLLLSNSWGSSSSSSATATTLNETNLAQIAAEIGGYKYASEIAADARAAAIALRGPSAAGALGKRARTELEGGQQLFGRRSTSRVRDRKGAPRSASRARSSPRAARSRSKRSTARTAKATKTSSKASATKKR